MLKTSIVISFYNKPEYLRCILASLQNQSFKNFEVIIADDGSNINIVRELELILNNYCFPCIHLWQENKGFRKNKILNKAILAASTDYLIFIDGDCILHPEFIKEHFTNKVPGTCLTGRRVNLSKKITKELTPKKIHNHYFSKNHLKLLIDGIFGNSFDVEKGLYFPFRLLRKIINKKQRGILGCNFSLFKKDILAINGFDERYEAPSIGEDSDIQYRLELNNIKIQSLNNVAVQYHMYHKLQPRPEKNLILFAKIKKEGEIFTPFGIKKQKH